MLKVNNINVYYGKIHALKDVSFEVKAGEVVALIGANGAGKSTTLKTISGMLRSRTGSIEFLGENITHTESHKLVYKGLAHVPEGRRIFLQMTVLENLEMGAYIHKSPTKAELDDIFARFPRLLERKSQIAGTLSGGEQQMLAMGRALMSKPKMIVMDADFGSKGWSVVTKISQITGPSMARVSSSTCPISTLLWMAVYG